MGELAYEVIVVDNGSSVDWKHQLPRFDDATVLTNASNRGFAAAANQGAARARGDLLLFLNTDVLLEPGCVVDLVALLRENREFAALAATAVGEGGCRRPPGFNFLTPVNHAGEMLGLTRLGLRRFCVFERSRGQVRRCLSAGDDADLQDADWVRASTLLVRVEAFRSICGFDEGYFFYEEDEDLCWRLRRRGYAVAECSSVSVADPGGGSATGVREWAVVSLYAGQQRFVYRRGGVLALFAYRVCVTLALLAKIALPSHPRSERLRHHHGCAIAILKSLWQPIPKAPTIPA